MPGTPSKSAVHPKTRTASFSRWFSGSAVTDESGSPLVVYHGTPNHFEVFDTFPAYFTSDPEAAQAYAENQFARDGHEGEPKVMHVYLALKNPKVFTAEELYLLVGDEEGIDWTAVESMAYSLEAQGFDGIILRGIEDFAGMISGERQTKSYDQYIAFRPGQILNAIENKRSCDLETPGLGF